jgi:uncharacterized protein YukE
VPEHLYVDPAALRASVAAVADARQALTDARSALERAGASVDGGIDHSRQADDKVRTFVRQWRAECGLIADMLGAYADVVEGAASSYEGADCDAAAAISGAGG